MNKVDNIFIARMSSEEFSEAWRTKATKKRLEGLGDWADLSLKTLLVRHRHRRFACCRHGRGADLERCAGAVSLRGGVRVRQSTQTSKQGAHGAQVDPPRAGLDPQTLELAQSFDSIVYISCNPQTLHDNLRTLIKTHRLVRFAAFDQFPYTHHLESGVYLERRQ